MKKLLTNDALVKNIAMATGILGALLMALNIGLFVLAYVLFLTSSILWGVYGYTSQNKQLLIMNIVFTVINLIGLVRFS